MRKNEESTASKFFREEAAAYEKRFEQSRIHPDDTLPWQSVGRVLHIQVSDDHTIALTCEEAAVELQWQSDVCVRIRVQAEVGFTPPFSSAVVDRVKSPVGWNVTESHDLIDVRIGHIRYMINKDPFQIHVHGFGDLICRDAGGPQLRDDGAIGLSIRMSLDEDSYGLGERAHGLNLRGGRYALWNTDAKNYERHSDPLSYCVPFYLGVHSGSAYGVFWDNTHRGVVDVGATIPDELRFRSEGGALQYYLIVAHQPHEVIAQFSNLTGSIPLPPIWGLGYHQAGLGDTSQEMLLEVATEFRSRQIPCDGLYLDIHHMDQYKVFTWNNKAFPDPNTLLKTLHARGFGLIASLVPGIKKEAGYAPYDSGLEQDVFVAIADENAPLEVVCWPGVSLMPDFTRSTTRSWWQEHVRSMLDSGIDGIWNDMNEPTVFVTDRTVGLPDTTQHDLDGQAGNHIAAHNIYGMDMARATHEALVEHQPNQRPFNLTRAGFAGTQRYASSWTGDNTSSWDDLRLSIPMVLNMGLSGAPFTGPNIGGFHGDTDGELLSRWTQAGCLMPFFRNHSEKGTAAQVPWAFGPKHEKVIRAAIELRYQLMPYLYSVVAQSHEYGWPVVRPLFMLEQDNPELRDIDDIYLLGDALLVAPILEKGATAREVYLPSGEWYDFHSGSVYHGGRSVRVVAPLEKLPLFVRAGTVLPIWPVMQHLAKPEVAELTMRIYPGTAETVLYEDAGEGMAYQTGAYRWVYLNAAWADGTLTVKRRAAGRYAPNYKMIRLIVHGFHEEPHNVQVDRQGAPIWFYDSGLLELSVEPFASLTVTSAIGPGDPTIARRPW